MTTRRQALAISGVALGSGFGLARRALGAEVEGVDPAGLMQPGPLGDIWLGSETAKVTIIEYGAVTCTHCAAFHSTTWPVLKERYIDTGRVRFALRGFILNALDTAGFMLAHGKGDARYYPITDLLFDQQRAWAFTEKPVDALEQILRQAGYTKDSFEACLKDQSLYSGVSAVAQRAQAVFKVDSTPTFFINGRRFGGAMTLDAIEGVIKPILGP